MTTNMHKAWQYNAWVHIPFAGGPDMNGCTGINQRVGGIVLCDVVTAEELVEILKSSAAKKGHTLLVGVRDIVPCLRPMRVTKTRELVG